MDGLINRVNRQIMQKEANMKEFFLRAFLEETGLKPTEAFMHVQITDTGQKIWFERNSQSPQVGK